MKIGGNTLRGTKSCWRVAGRIGLDGAPLLAEELRRRIDGGASRMLVDLSAVDYVNSAGLRILEAAARQLAERGGGLALAAVREPVRLVLEMAGLSAIVAVEETHASAVLRLSRHEPLKGKTMTNNARPDRTEAADYYFKYIDLVPAGDITTTLETQREEMATLLASVPPEKIDFRYEPDKWTVREVLGHLNDTERLFMLRAFWFARGFDTPLPSFDQHVAMRHAGVGDRPWKSLADEFLSLRDSTVEFFRHLPPDAWLRRGIASDCPFTVRALAYLGAGHVIHHVNILRDRYL